MRQLGPKLEKKAANLVGVKELVRCKAESRIRFRISITGSALLSPLAKIVTPISSLGRKETSVESPGRDPV